MDGISMKVYNDRQSGPEDTLPTERVKVGIAEYQVTTDGADLTTSGLGSCIGVALYDADANVAGLVHVMLPSAEDTGGGNPAKFADTGTSHLLSEMAVAGADLDAVVAKIAGGSDMLDFSESGAGIGERNAEAVRTTLSDHGVEILAADLGGDHGRSLRFEPASGDLVVKRANKGATRL